MVSKPRIPLQYALVLINLVERQGFVDHSLSTPKFSTSQGASPLSAQIEEEDFVALSNAALQITGDHGLGLKLGSYLNISASSYLSAAMFNAKNLAQAYDLITNYGKVAGFHNSWSFYTQGNHRIIQCDSYPAFDNPLFYFEFVTSGLYRCLQNLVVDKAFSVGVEFPYPPPPHAAQYYELFGQSVHFNRKVCRLSHNLDWEQLTLKNHNPTMLKLYVKECLRLNRLLIYGPLSRRTLDILNRRVGDYPKTAAMAQLLNLSERTFSRRLHEEGYTYRQLLETARIQRATELLQNTKLSVARIAQMMGFNDDSNFRHAYKRWTHQSVSDIRSSIHSKAE